MDDEANDMDEVDDLVAALRKNKKDAKKAIAMPSSLSKEQMEQFILDTSASLVTKGVALMDELQIRVSTAGSPEEIAAFAELHRATTSSLETLTKLLKTDKDNATRIAVKKMDVEVKKMEIEGNTGSGDGNGMLMTREGIMKLINKATEDIKKEREQEPKQISTEGSSKDTVDI